MQVVIMTHPISTLICLTPEDEGKKKKVKCTLVQALRLCTGHRGSRGIALPFHDHGTRRR
jgi:hypothetical protein